MPEHTTTQRVLFPGIFKRPVVAENHLRGIGRISAIQDGNTASASWLNLTGNTMSPVGKEKLAADMLAYCKRDTQAMVALLDRVRAAAK